MSLSLLACDGGSSEDSGLRRGERPRADSGRGGEGSFEGEATACASYLQSLLDELQGGPTAPPPWANSDVTPGGLIALGGGSIGVGNGGVTTVADLPGQCAAIEAELGLPVGYLQPGTESTPGGYVEGCACTDCGMEPDAEGLDTFDSVGLGDAVSPHEIYNPEQLADLAEAEPAWDQHYVQCADIDLEPYYASGGDEFSIAAQWQHFRGVYDGQAHRISNYTNHEHGGLFDSIASAEIRQLTLEGADVIRPAEFDEHRATGSLVNSGQSSTLEDVHLVDSSVVFEVGGQSFGRGGLVGTLSNSELRDASVVDSWVSCVEVPGGETTTCSFAGMLGVAYSVGAENCEVAGTQILGEGGASAAGVVGYGQDSDFSNIRVSDGLISGWEAGGFARMLHRSVASDVQVATTLEGKRVGGLVTVLWKSTLSDSHASNEFLPTDTDFEAGRLGGLVGYFGGDEGADGVIQRCTADMTFEDINSTGYGRPVGGLVATVSGGNSDTGHTFIEDSFAVGDVSVAFGAEGPVTAGGLIGEVAKNATLTVTSSYAAGSLEGATTGAFIGRVADGASVTATESFAIGHHNGTGGCFVGSGTINEDGNNYVADIPCACTVEPGVSTAPLNDFDQPNDNLGFSWSTAVWAFADNMLPALQ